METSKSKIGKETKSRKIALSNQCNYTYQIQMNENYTKDTDGIVLHNVGNSSKIIGYAYTKKQFIELVYSHVTAILIIKNQPQCDN